MGVFRSQEVAERRVVQGDDPGIPFHRRSASHRATSRLASLGELGLKLVEGRQQRPDLDLVCQLDNFGSVHDPTSWVGAKSLGSAACFARLE